MGKARKETTSLSVIIPLYNSQGWIGATLERLFVALSRSSFDAEVIIVNDGSTDGSVEEVEAVSVPKGVTLKLINKKNQGRYLARKTGVEAAKNDNILFLDSRVFVDENALAYLSQELKNDPKQIWNGHVHVVKKGNPFARFWDAIAFIGWRRYFKNPRKTQYGLADFDHYPKGTGFFFVPKATLTEAMKWFEATTGDIEHSSDDTLLIRHMAEKHPIHLSPDFSCHYNGRSNLQSFLKHGYHRGEFFIDGFLRPGTRFFYLLLGVLTGSVAALLLLIIFPEQMIFILLGMTLLFGAGLFTGAKLLGVGWRDAGALGGLGVPFAAVYLCGLWRGVLRRLTKKPRRSTRRAAFLKVVRRQRSLLNGSILEYVLVALLYAVAAMIITQGTFLHITHQIFGGVGDATNGFLWLNSFDSTLNPFLGHSSYVNYPYGQDVGGVTLLSYFSYWLPMRALSLAFGPIAALNLSLWFAFVSSALAMYWLVKRTTGNKLIAFFAGYAVAFVPYSVIKGADHLSYLFNGVFSLIIGTFIAFWRHARLKLAVALAILMIVACYTDGYFILLTFLLMVALTLAGVVYSVFVKKSVRELVSRAKYLVISILILGIALAPYMAVAITQSASLKTHFENTRNTVDDEMKRYQSKVKDFIIPPRYHVVWQRDSNFVTVSESKNADDHSNYQENTDYIAFTLYAICFAGLVVFSYRFIKYRKYTDVDGVERPRVVFFAIALFLIACPLILSVMFSPSITIGQWQIALPGKILIDYNIGMWRVISRPFIIFNVVVVFFAAIMLWVLTQSKFAVRKVGTKAKRGATVVVVGCFLLVAFEYAMYFPHLPFDYKKAPATFAWIKDQPSIKSVIYLPYVDVYDGRSQYFLYSQEIHKKPMVNYKEADYSRLTNAIGSVGNPETINFIKDRNVDAVIAANSDCRDYEWGKVVYRDQGSLRYCVIRVDKSKSADNAYVVFGNGFRPNPNTDDQTVVTFRKGASGLMKFTSDDFTTVHKGKINFQAEIGFGSLQKNAKWRIVQNGKEVAGGPLSQSGRVTLAAPINVDIDGSLPTRIEVVTPGHEPGEAEAYLKSVIVTAVN